MKKLLAFALVTVCLFAFVIPSMAADKVISMKVDSVTQAMTRTGSPYVRVIVSEKATLQGITYDNSVPAMFFGPKLVAEGSKLKEGDTLRAIVSQRDFNGRVSYTVKAVLPPEAPAKK